jgi:hypothetical protein
MRLYVGVKLHILFVEEHKLRESGTKRCGICFDVRKNTRKLHNEELIYLYSSPTSVKVIKKSEIGGARIT